MEASYWGGWVLWGGGALWGGGSVCDPAPFSQMSQSESSVLLSRAEGILIGGGVLWGGSSVGGRVPV